MYKVKAIVAIVSFFTIIVPLGVICSLVQEVHLIYDVLCGNDDDDNTSYDNVARKYEHFTEELLTNIGKFFGLE